MSTGTLARLAKQMRIDLADDERDALKGRLEEFVALAATLEEVDAADSPTWELPAERAELRPDEPEPSLSRERALSFAPATKDGFFRVPRTVEDSH